MDFEKFHSVIAKLRLHRSQGMCIQKVGCIIKLLTAYYLLDTIRTNVYLGLVKKILETKEMLDSILTCNFNRN